MRKSFLMLFLLFFTLSFSGCLGTQNTAQVQKATLTGTVHDSLSGLALWSGQVVIGDQSAAIKGGIFEIKNISPGSYTLRITNPFYHPLEQKVIISNSNITLTDLKLRPAFTSEELDLFARLVHAEAKGESYVGQVAVAATVLNRILSPDFPNSLEAVIKQVVVVGATKYYQYEPVLNGSIDFPAGDSAKNAVLDALAGWDPSLGATGFFAPAKVPKSSKYVWSRPVTTNIGNHRFIK
ncbi:MAG: hypothetical protein GX335_06050 [Firmicutes bacterium]|nr:hypothetical protein [Bacillota bacterium]